MTKNPAVARATGSDTVNDARQTMIPLHRARVERWSLPPREPRRHGEPHPVMDFLLLRILQVEPHELDPSQPYRSQELFDEFRGELLTDASAVAKAEGRVSGRVAHRVRSTVHHTVDGAERPAAVADRERAGGKGQRASPSPPRLVVVGARWCRLIA